MLQSQGACDSRESHKGAHACEGSAMWIVRSGIVVSSLVSAPRLDWMCCLSPEGSMQTLIPKKNGEQHWTL